MALQVCVLALLFCAIDASPSYSIELLSHSPLPVLSSANPPGHGNSDGCLIFNPSWIPASKSFNQTGLLVRECCGASCTGHGRRSAPHAERISFAPCDLSTGICGDAIQSFNLDPDADTEDPRAIWVDPWYYLFYYRFPVATGSKCVGEQCTVQLSRTVTPLVPGSWERIATLPWHRNGCCLVRPGGRSWCMWGEGPSPFPGLGISYTDDFGVGEFHPTTWKLGVDNSSSPISEDGMWLLPFGPEQEEIKLEAGTHMHELSSGAVVTFYAAATPGWVPNGNYTVGWLILDGEDPTRILQRSQQHLLVPTFDYETLCPGQPNCTYSGERHNVIFLSSATPMDGYQDRFRLFFGGGDGNVGTAVVQVTLN